jgi:hypothetical protein
VSCWRVTAGAQAAGRHSRLAWSLQHRSGVIRWAHKLWQDLRALRAGKRFQHFYDAHEAKRVGWARGLTWLSIVVCFVIGIVLAFVPGPAILFFALSAALLATQSRWMARKLDRSELYFHAFWRRQLRRRRERRARGPVAPPPRKRPSARRRAAPASERPLS